MSRPADRNAPRVLEVLKLFGDVEWARLNVGTDADDSPALPVVVWRFADSSRLGAEALAQLMNECMGPNWVLEHRGRNWTLWPKALAQEFATGHWRTDTDAAISLAGADRDLAADLADEFWRFVGVLEGEDA